MYTQIILLIFGLHSISAHTLARIELRNGSEVYIVEELANNTVEFINPETKSTLREILFYHVVEKPYHEQHKDKDKPSQKQEETPLEFDASGRAFTNGHGYQYADWGQLEDQLEIEEDNTNVDNADDSYSVDSGSGDEEEADVKQLRATTKSDDEEANTNDNDDIAQTPAGIPDIDPRIDVVKSVRNDKFNAIREKYQTRQRNNSATEIVRNRRQIEYLDITEVPTYNYDIASPTTYPTILEGSFDNLMVDPTVTNDYIYDDIVADNDYPLYEIPKENFVVADNIYDVTEVPTSNVYDLTSTTSRSPTVVQDTFDNLIIEPTATNGYIVGDSIYDDTGANNDGPLYVVEENKEINKPKKNFDVADEIYIFPSEATVPKKDTIKNLNFEISIATSPLSKEVTPPARDDEDKTVLIIETVNPKLKSLDPKNETKAKKDLSPTEPITSDHNTTTDFKVNEAREQPTDAQGNNTNQINKNQTKADKERKTKKSDNLLKMVFWNMFTKWVKSYMAALHENFKILIKDEMARFEKYVANKGSETAANHSDNYDDHKNKMNNEQTNTSNDTNASSEPPIENGTNIIENNPVTQENSGSNVINIGNTENGTTTENESLHNKTIGLKGQDKIDTPTLNVNGVVAKAMDSSSLNNNSIQLINVTLPMMKSVTKMNKSDVSKKDNPAVP